MVFHFENCDYHFPTPHGHEICTFFFFRNFSANVLESWNSEGVQAAKRNWVKKDWITSGFCCVHLGTFLCFCAISHSVSLLSICLFLSSLSICWSLSVSCPTPRLTLPCASTHTHTHTGIFVCTSAFVRTLRHSPQPLNAKKQTETQFWP